VRRCIREICLAMLVEHQLVTYRMTDGLTQGRSIYGASGRLCVINVTSQSLQFYSIRYPDRICKRLSCQCVCTMRKCPGMFWKMCLDNAQSGHTGYMCVCVPVCVLMTMLVLGAWSEVPYRWSTRPTGK